MNKKIVVLVIAHEGYQQVEYGVTREILASDHTTVLTASDKDSVAIAKDHSSTTVDLTLGQIQPTNIDGLFLIGGPGALELLNTPQVHSLLQHMKALQKPYGAICISTRILAYADVLSGKKATGWNGDHKLEDIYKQYGVTYVNHPAVSDGNVVTAEGPAAAQEFAQAILKALGNL